MASRHYRQSARACTAPKGRPVTVISANFGPAAAGPGNSEKCRPGACCGGPARGYRQELRMSDVRVPSQIYRKVGVGTEPHFNGAGNGAEYGAERSSERIRQCRIHIPTFTSTLS